MWRWIGMRPAMASIPEVGDVQDAPTIHSMALLYMFSLREYKSGALL